MRFGIIGAGNIGSVLSEKLVKLGYDVKIADARGMEHLEGKELTGTPVSVEDVLTNIDILIISLPLHVIPSIRNIIDKVGDEVVIVDTSNYYPHRDNKIEEIENGMAESVWVSNQLGRPIIKAFNNLTSYTLENEGTPEGTRERLAISIAGNDLPQRQIIMDVVNELGFDTVDCGPLSESWRQQPGTPAYCTALTKEELTKALDRANKERAPLLRDKATEIFSSLPDGHSNKETIKISREVFNS